MKITTDTKITLPITRFVAITLSIISLLLTVTISYATYREQFHQIQKTVEKQQIINEKTQDQIVQLQITMAKLQTAIEKNTEAVYARKR